MKDILEYQKLDMQLYRLERTVKSSEQRKTMSQMITLVKDAQAKSVELENKAKKLNNDYVILQKQYGENYKKVQKLIDTKLDDLSKEDCDSLFANINTYSSELFMIERNLNIILNNIKECLKDFEVTKKNVIVAKTKHKDAKLKYEQEMGLIQPQIDEIKNKMLALEKTLDKKVFEKYKMLKNDNIFPVFVTLKNKHCSGCMMELPSGKIDQLKNNPYIVCEQCRRLIINE